MSYKKPLPFPSIPWQDEYNRAYYFQPSSRRMSSLPGPGPQGSQQQQPQQGRCMELIQSIPLCTLLVTTICCLIQAGVFFLGWDIGRYAISTGDVIYAHQWYRIITSPFFHVGLLHILMNMASLVFIGQWLEVTAGTVYLFCTILWSCILTNLLYILICWLLAFYILHNLAWLAYASVGFSGVLFTMAVLETHYSPVPTRSVFGCFNVPSKLYPWVLLIIIQVMMPNISFVGHLSGLLIGVVQAHRGMKCLLPSATFIRYLDTHPKLAWLTRNRHYMPCPDAFIERELQDRERSMASHLYQVGAFFVSAVVSVFKTIWDGIQWVYKKAKEMWNGPGGGYGELGPNQAPLQASPPHGHGGGPHPPERVVL